MATTTYTPFMLGLHAQILANDCTESTANLYLSVLRKFNGDAPFRNLAFLRQTHFIDALNSVGYAVSTQKSHYSTFISVLRVAGLSEKATYKKAFKHYTDKFAEVRAVVDAAADGTMTEKEKEAWIPWTEIMATYKRIQTTVVPILGYKSLTIAQYNDLVAYTILSLYVLTPPRRNKDYHEMYLVPTWDESMPTNNYYCWATKRFIFGAYKTAGTYGVQIVATPEPLQLVLADFVRHHPVLKGKVGPRTEMTRLFVNYDATFNPATNVFTRILQRIFHPHKISIGALRHMYLNEKLNLKAMTEDATAMGHSVDGQRGYLRTDAPASGGAGVGAGAHAAGADDGKAACGAGVGAGAHAAGADDGKAAGGAGASYYEPVGNA